MTGRDQYTPGPAGEAEVRKGGEKWTLILVRELCHSPEKVWQALTDPAHLREWAPFEADGSLGTVGTTVNLTTVGAPTPHTEKLGQTHGVICPPDIDRGMKAPMPDAGKTPVIPPPGSPGGNPNVQPK